MYNQGMPKEKPVSLQPLQFEEALKMLLTVKPSSKKVSTSKRKPSKKPSSL